jgi:Haem-NO-binding
VKKKAECKVPDNGFLKLQHYSDSSTYDLVRAASEVSGLTAEQIYETFGEYFVDYINNEGYEDLLCCQGSTLKDWCANINEIHSHLQTTFPKKMIMPEFWTEQSPDGTLLLHYHSKRGKHLAPLAKGIVKKVAKFKFELDIVFDLLVEQGDSGSRFTT